MFIVGSAVGESSSLGVGGIGGIDAGGRRLV